ncbi:MAG: tetratricopeptide repeat protein, partial [Planctomycetota bacterium]|nr:tetratricopeptide repeat protein [Planctomycetota bacterium]
AEKDARATAEAEVQRRKKTLTEFAAARSLLRRGRPKAEIVQTIKAAVNVRAKTSLDEQLRASEILEEAGAFDEAEALLTRALAKNPGRVSILYSLHFIQLKKNGQSEQIFTVTDALTQLLSLSKQSKEKNEYTHFAKAQELIEASQFNEAIEELDSIEDYTSSLEGAKLQKGLCALQLKKYNLAISTLTDVIKRNPRSRDAYFLRGVGY